MKILFVLTSHEKLGNTEQKTGFWLEEFADPYYVFKDAGANIVLASPIGGQPPIDPKSKEPDFQTESTLRLNKDCDAQFALASTVKLSEISPDQYDAVFYPGGHGPLWDLAENPNSIDLIEKMHVLGKLIGAVCHAPAVFLKTKNPDGSSFIKGKSITGFSNSEEEAVGLRQVVPFLLENELKEQGANYSKAGDWIPYVVTDDNLVTGQNPASSILVAKKMLEKLKNE